MSEPLTETAFTTLAREARALGRNAGPDADLSGEWADGYTPRRLMTELGLDPDTVDGEDASALCDAFEEGVQEERGDDDEQD